MPYTLLAPCHSDFVIKKSRFVGCVQAVATRDEVTQVVQALRAEHPRATHVCWAFMAGGQSAAADDGEPSGTAGRPMLEVLRHHDLHNVLATVVRYYGGVKLGAGGLVRAYTDAVAQALLGADKQASIAMHDWRFSCDYAQEGLVRRALTEPVQLLTITHTDRVHWHVRLPVDQAHAWWHALVNACHGSLVLAPPND